MIQVHVNATQGSRQCDPWITFRTEMIAMSGRWIARSCMRRQSFEASIPIRREASSEAVRDLATHVDGAGPFGGEILKVQPRTLVVVPIRPRGYPADIL